MTNSLRVVTLNLCYEYPENKDGLLKKWVKILSKIEGDIIFLQEISNYNLEKLAAELEFKILNINNFDGTCVFINPRKLIILENKLVKLKSGRKPIYIGGMHLDDVPSLPHHIAGVIYKSSEIIPLSSSLASVLKMCEKRRLPILNDEFKCAKPYDRAIIAGDFNEPSHLDIDGINTPVSKAFEKNGFIDTYRHMNKRTPSTIQSLSKESTKETNVDDPGYTWPVGKLYKTEPKQRIDMIYTRNLKIQDSFVYEGDIENGFKWPSDHKMVIADLHI